METIFTTPILLASLLLGFATTAIASEGDSCYSELAGLAGHISYDIRTNPVDPREAKFIKRELDRGYKAAWNAKQAMKRGDINAAYRT